MLSNCVEIRLDAPARRLKTKMQVTFQRRKWQNAFLKTISMKRLPFGSDTMALRSVRIMKIPNEFALVIKIALCNTLCLLRVLLCVVVYCWACLRACNLIYVLFWCAYILSILLCPANQTVEPNAV